MGTFSYQKHSVSMIWSWSVNYILPKDIENLIFKVSKLGKNHFVYLDWWPLSPGDAQEDWYFRHTYPNLYKKMTWLNKWYSKYLKSIKPCSIIQNIIRSDSFRTLILLDFRRNWQLFSADKICLYRRKEIKGNCMTGDETVSWLQFAW